MSRFEKWNLKEMTPEERREKLLQTAAQENAAMIRRSGGYSARYGETTISDKVGRSIEPETLELFKMVDDGVPVKEAAKLLGMTHRRARDKIRWWEKKQS